MKGNCLKVDAEPARRGYRRGMPTIASSGQPGQARRLDVGIVVVTGALTAIAVWHGGEVGDRIHGPIWLRAVFPVLLNLPLLWRRTRPLESWVAIMAAVGLQALISGSSPEGLEMIAPWVIGSYSVAAYSTRRNAVIGFAIGIAGYGIYASQDANIRTGRASELWAGAFFGLAFVAAWLVGLFVHTRRNETAAHARAAAIEHEARNAVADERARMARELHDIVSHKLSVVVVQAAGARAQRDRAADDVADTLEKIEQSGRDALVEMRRLLGVLRSDDAEPSLAPQPGIGDLPDLVETVRVAGLPVTLDVAPDCDGIPPAAGLSAYRIVQEALTNTLKHAHATAATVSLRREGEALSVVIVDDGAGGSDESAGSAGGYGLVGMSERVKLLGGELRAGPFAAGGFGVHVTLPVGGAS